jgi:pantoate--beta-alanine ligase
MGYLHEGHLALVDRARSTADVVALSLFVNPLQFGVGEDLERYPRDQQRDTRLAAERGVDMIFAPSTDEVYPRGQPVVRVSPGPLAHRLCGRFRPGHFEGVLTVVAKLFNILQPDVAIFGLKDFQQSVLIRRMVDDLDMPVEIQVAPTVREPDGLAMSSRNAYLSATERTAATSLYRGLSEASSAFRAGERDAARLCDVVVRTIQAEPPARVQYVELVAADTLEPLERAEPGTVIAVAAHVGATRLIDNVQLGE